MGKLADPAVGRQVWMYRHAGYIFYCDWSTTAPHENMSRILFSLAVRLPRAMRTTDRSAWIELCHPVLSVRAFNHFLWYASVHRESDMGFSNTAVLLLQSIHPGVLLIRKVFPSLWPRTWNSYFVRCVNHVQEEKKSLTFPGLAWVSSRPKTFRFLGGQASEVEKNKSSVQTPG